VDDLVSGRDKPISAAARLMRAYATQVEVLRRLRHGKQEVVRVEHVHVNDGGQAGIGNVKKPDTLSHLFPAALGVGLAKFGHDTVGCHGHSR
jgi:hypothetical protein